MVTIHGEYFRILHFYIILKRLMNLSKSFGYWVLSRYNFQVPGNMLASYDLLIIIFYIHSKVCNAYYALDCMNAWYALRRYYKLYRYTMMINYKICNISYIFIRINSAWCTSLWEDHVYNYHYYIVITEHICILLLYSQNTEKAKGKRTRLGIYFILRSYNNNIMRTRGW